MKLKFGVLLTIVFTMAMSSQVFAELNMNIGKVVNGRTMIPLRGAFEELGFVVSWDNSTNTATLKDSDHVINVKKDSKNFIVDGVSYTSDVAPQLINGTLYIPLRSIGDTIGAETSWNSEEEFAKIDYNGDRTFIYARSKPLSTSTRYNTHTTLEIYLDALEEAEGIYEMFGKAMTYVETEPDTAKAMLLEVRYDALNLEDSPFINISDDCKKSLYKYTDNLIKSLDECIKYIDGKKNYETIEQLHSYYMNSNEYAHYAAAGLEEMNLLLEGYWAKVKPE